MPLLTEPALAAPLPCNVNSPELPCPGLTWPGERPLAAASPMDRGGWTQLDCPGCPVGMDTHWAAASLWGGSCICPQRGLAMARRAVTSPGLVLRSCWGCADPHVLVKFLLLQVKG